MKHYLCLDGWHGRSQHLVELVGETPKRYRVRLLEDNLMLPSRRRAHYGDVVLVPKYAIKADCSETGTEGRE